MKKKQMTTRKKKMTTRKKKQTKQKTQKTKQTKQTTARRLHQYKTYRRHGGLIDPCRGLRIHFDELKARVQTMTLNTFEDIWSDIRSLQDAAKNNNDCARLAYEIEKYENTVLKNKTNALHGRIM